MQNAFDAEGFHPVKFTVSHVTIVSRQSTDGTKMKTQKKDAKKIKIKDLPAGKKAKGVKGGQALLPAVKTISW
jgi:hypothetical protein